MVSYIYIISDNYQPYKTNNSNKILLVPNVLFVNILSFLSEFYFEGYMPLTLNMKKKVMFTFQD